MIIIKRFEPHPLRPLMNPTEMFNVLIKTNPFEILDPDILESLSARMTVKIFEQIGRAHV